MILCPPPAFYLKKINKMFKENLISYDSVIFFPLGRDLKLELKGLFSKKKYSHINNKLKTPCLNKSKDPTEQSLCH